MAAESKQEICLEGGCAEVAEFVDQCFLSTAFAATLSTRVPKTMECSIHPLLLPRCSQDRTNHPHLGPSRLPPELWFLAGLGCLRLDQVQFLFATL
jgi:hypothetical protein